MHLIRMTIKREGNKKIRTEIHRYDTQEEIESLQSLWLNTGFELIDSVFNSCGVFLTYRRIVRVNAE